MENCKIKIVEKDMFKIRKEKTDVAVERQTMGDKQSINEELKKALEEYNYVYEQFHKKGTLIYEQRSIADELLKKIEKLINSIAKHPKKFDTEIMEIEVARKEFETLEEFAKQELSQAKKSVTGIAAGVTAGAATAGIAPSVAVWIATTFGTASTGTAISTLSGAAAANAALAWLGGGAVAAGGAGTAGGAALLALAGPVGWGIAGVSVFASVVLFTKNQMEQRDKKIEEIENIKNNIRILMKTYKEMELLSEQTEELYGKLRKQYDTLCCLSGKNYLFLMPGKKAGLGALVNNAKSLSALIGKTIEQ